MIFATSLSPSHKFASWRWICIKSLVLNRKVLRLEHIDTCLNAWPPLNNKPGSTHYPRKKTLALKPQREGSTWAPPVGFTVIWNDHVMGTATRFPLLYQTTLKTKTTPTLNHPSSWKGRGLVLANTSQILTSFMVLVPSKKKKKSLSSFCHCWLHSFWGSKNGTGFSIYQGLKNHYFC